MMTGKRLLLFNISIILIFYSGILYSQAVKIMPLGNSITRGVTGSPLGAGYRRPLFTLLTGAGFNVNFVGSQVDGSQTDFDRDHEGHSGWVADGPTNSIAANVYNWLVLNPAQIVLLEIGTNDIDGGDSAQQVVTDVNTILNEIDRYKTNSGKSVKVILAKITNRSDVLTNSTKSQITTAYNNGLQQLYQTRIASPYFDDMMIVDMENGAGLDYHIDNTVPFTSGNMYDIIHPNDSGYLKLAQVWFNALKTVLSPLQPSPLPLSSPANNAVNQNTNLTFSWGAYSGASIYRLQIATDNTFSSLFLDQDNISSTSFSVSGLNPDSKYYWRVIAKSNSTTNLFYSETWNFTVRNGMISYWKLDETSGSTYVDALGLNNATGNAAPTPTAGRVNGAQLFNGSTTKIDVPANSSFDFASNASFSAEFWFKGSSIPTTAKAAIGRYISSNGAKWYVGLNANDGRAIFYMSGGGASASTKGPVITDGNWHHVAATRNGSNGSMKIYVDGVLSGSAAQAFTTAFSSSASNLNIGWLSLQNVFTLNGTLDEVAISNGELSASVIQQHYNNGLAGKGYTSTPTQTAPVITSSPTTTGTVGQAYSYDVNATGNPTPTYSLVTFPTGMTINSSTGVISWTPSATGNFSVKVQAANGVSPNGTQSFTIAVTSGSSAPVITSTAVTNAVVGQQYTYDVNASGSPAPTYSLTTFPSGMTINSGTGVITWTPSATGNYNVTVKASNGISPDAQQSFSVSVTNTPACPNGIVSYWKLNETTQGSYNDFTGTNDGSSTAPPTPVTGKVNGAQLFNGSTNQITVPSSSQFDIAPSGNFSVEFWFKGSSIPTTAKSAIGRYISSNGAKWYVGLNANDGRAIFYMSGGGASAATRGPAITDGNWHHVAATRNGATGAMKIYVDGVLGGSASQLFSSGFTSSSSNLNIGWLSFQSVFALNGALDEVAFFNIELSSSVIAQHYNNGLAGKDYCGQSLAKQAAADSILTSGNLAYKLDQNYPNPFNPVTTISYTLSEPQHVTLTVYDVLGKAVTVLVNEEKPAGNYKVTFNGEFLSSGIYFYNLKAGSFVQTRKLILMK